jgi:membrane protease YdiL (CAAX protease family)
MSKPVFGLLLGGFLGILDGLTALISAPEKRPVILSIVIGSTIKGVIAGLIIGFIARKTRSLATAVVLGGLVGLALALPIALMEKYYWEIMLPGAVLGLIVGYATMRHGAAPALPAQ